MSQELESLIAEAEGHAKHGDMQAAIARATDLTIKYPEEVRVWMLRGFLHKRASEHDAAVVDFSSAILVEPKEPVLFLQRGLCRLALGDSRNAVDDFTEGLHLCDYYGDTYYPETLLFLRAAALIRLRQRAAALADLGLVQDDFRWWTDKLVYKKELMDECLRLPE